MTFRAHCITQVTGRLLKKAEDALLKKDYQEVFRIATTQLAFNTCGIALYYNIPKECSYDRIQYLPKLAFTEQIPIHDRAVLVVEELRLVSSYFKQIIPTSFNVLEIKQ